MEVNKYVDLGPWSSSDILETAGKADGTGADADLPAHVRFISGVARLIRRRLSEVGINNDPLRPGIFLLESKPRLRKPTEMPKRVPMLNNGLETVTGRLWFVSSVVVQGSYIELEDCDDDELFRIITDDLQLGNVPTVVFEPRTSIPYVRFYPKGLNNTEAVTESPVTNVKVSLEQVFNVIDHVYEHALITPDAQSRAGKLWENVSRYWPSKTAEDTVQLYLRIALTTAFPTCIVRPEQPDTPGRLDLEIEEIDHLSSRITRHAILELKILRSYRSNGTSVSEQETLDWIDSGVKQAAAYCKKRKALYAALCCFDMRRESSGEKCFEHVKEQATRLQVALKLWFIYATSKEYREVFTASY